MLSVMKAFAAATMAATLFSGCKKDSPFDSVQPSDGPNGFIKFTIPAGGHNSNNVQSEAINTAEYKFQVYFDSSAIYTLPAEEQLDINKLSGFADNGADHLLFSARFGWRWSEDQLRLFGFVHNNGNFEHLEIGVISIGKIYTCSIKVNGSKYVFTVEGLNAITLPRAATTATANGYRLFPYFGGNNVAPREINIWLKYLP